MKVLVVYELFEGNVKVMNNGIGVYEDIGIVVFENFVDNSRFGL